MAGTNGRTTARNTARLAHQSTYEAPMPSWLASESTGRSRGHRQSAGGAAAGPSVQLEPQPGARTGPRIQ